MMSWLDLNCQNSATPLMEQLSFFHNNTMMILIIITIIVAYMMTSIVFNNKINRFLLENQQIELIWTITPALTLLLIALPSLKILYMLEETLKPNLSIKSIGHQWFWSYEYSDFKNIEFDSYLLNESNSMNNFNFRLLDVDNRLILPYFSQIRMIVTSTDVIHSWTIPSMGLKVDATPGRLNQIVFFLNRSGLFFGQCSEICGTNHSFMPIVIESISPTNFISWLKNKI
uniref:Cytochrome c oxidase subunit 2 n=1 Tax=Lycocerus asperipennis TaxID=2806094 RepID=A0A7U1BEC5_9COLE|nr:cytochrome c oxidase subunit II [Lycocerus asperipennis]QQY97876.1 cytochrome c oxidase subunit II [Lycocerus asperipennis]